MVEIDLRWPSAFFRVQFLLEPDGGEVLLKFCHGGWERGGDHCYYCNTTWGHLLVCLKDYAEKGVKNPYFK